MIDPIGSSMSMGMDQQTIGAQVVSNTLNTLNNQPNSSYMGSMMPMDQQTIGASVVSQTMDTMNSPMYGTTASMMGSQFGMSGMNQTYALNQQVLGAQVDGMNALATGLGGLANVRV